MSRWVETPPLDLRALPDSSGLHCVYLDDVLAYIGKSVCLRERVRQHGFPLAIADGQWKNSAFDRMRIKHRLQADVDGQLMTAERRLIGRLQPFLNVTHGPGKRHVARPRPLRPLSLLTIPCDAPAHVVRQVESDAMALNVSIEMAGLRANDVARILGRSETYISRMRSGERAIPAALVEPICNCTGTNLLKQVRALFLALRNDQQARVSRLASELRSAA